MIERIQSWLLAIAVACLPITLIELVLGVAFDAAAFIISAVITIAIAFVLAITALVLMVIEMLMDDIK